MQSELFGLRTRWRCQSEELGGDGDLPYGMDVSRASRERGVGTKAEPEHYCFGEGTDWLEKTLIRFHSGGGVMKDIDNMYYLSENMLGKTFCPLGDAAAMPTMAFVKKFRKEFEDHLEGKPCPFEKAGKIEQLPVYA